MSTDFTTEEKEHYDRLAASPLTDVGGAFQRHGDSLTQGTFRASYLAWRGAVQALPLKSLKVLDYGCGQGFHTVTLQQDLPRATITGVDISEPALRIGKSLAKDLLPGKRPRFLKMDAHDLSFPDASFDFVNDFGTLSSLQWDKALTEVARVLKPGGTFVGLETFGHNPITNFKRQLNVWRGQRTEWSARNILTRRRLEDLKHHFTRIDLQFFEITTLATALSPIRSRWVLDTLARADRYLIRNLPPFRRYAFKVLIVASKGKDRSG